ncbi:hypothetical protein DACRYDRAFT_15785 [Dacryopinax primogenitus]|uniref:PARP catalytic domain-containing protein n=1 Tax=Dacryopinax primogenitus (strain DJM 731) TaxID=1858805 RepID=M5G7E3_DACPD|nr:uncharacterized protein DACRYDRAFT_15785 [Dacryopinax primogenitus]EJU01762.1 hypothetical protein DACRYDRAFT_15785 [Dacryopinax primogenitus]
MDDYDDKDVALAEYEEHGDDELDEHGSWDDDDNLSPLYLDKGLDEVTYEMVQEAVTLAQTHLPNPEGIQLTARGPKIMLPVADMHPDTRQACGLSGFKTLFVLLDVTKGYKGSSPPPLIVASQGDDGQPSTSSERPNPRFSIGIQLVNSVQSDLVFPGLKPTICDAKLCSYQLDKLGIGAGLNLIDTDAVALSSGLTAASSGARLQFALPNVPSEHGTDLEIAPPRIVKALALTPVLAELPKDDDARSKILKEIDPLLEPIIRWILATNRAHVVSLRKWELFQQMKTPHQFKINTSTRAHASAFESMKQRHGSFYAWHGSSMANWYVTK